MLLRTERDHDGRCETKERTMIVLEILTWMAFGVVLALLKLRVNERPAPTARASVLTMLLCSAGGVVGGLVGLAAIRPPAELGDFNAASLMLSATGAALALLVDAAVVERRAERPHRLIRR
jgi:hypothetical protein